VRAASHTRKSPKSSESSGAEEARASPNSEAETPKPEETPKLIPNFLVAVEECRRKASLPFVGDPMCTRKFQKKMQKKYPGLRNPKKNTTPKIFLTEFFFSNLSSYRSSSHPRSIKWNFFPKIFVDARDEVTLFERCS
jgi:hypothetical protein